MPSFEEQGLCIGATFSLAATNGRDFDRRINILGFCQSIDTLNEAVEETVMSRGGEVLEQERKLKSGVHEQVRLSAPAVGVAVKSIVRPQNSFLSCS